MRNLPMELLRTFVTVADVGNLTKAGDRLGRSQPAVSLQLKKLEELVGAEIFCRDGRSLKLLPAGENLIVYARQILCLNDEALSIMQQKNVIGKVRVGLPNDFAVHYLPVILGQFSDAHPDVTLEVHCDISQALISDLEAGHHDLVIAMREGPGSVAAAKVWPESLTWLSHPKSTFDPSEPLPLITYPEGCYYRKSAIEALTRAGRQWRIAYTSPSLGGITAAVEAGLGVTVLAASTLGPDLKRYQSSSDYPGLPDLEVGIYYAPESMAQPVVRLINFAISAIDEAHPNSGTQYI